MSSVPSCETVTEYYYWNPKGEDNEDSTVSNGKWRTIETSELIGLTLYQEEYYMSWSLNQTTYLEELVPTFGPEVRVEDYVPELLNIDVMILTFDPTDQTKKVYDNFTLEIWSNGEVASDVCNFTTLVLTHSMTDKAFTYHVDGGDRRRNLQYSDYDAYYNNAYDYGSSFDDAYNNYAGTHDNAYYNQDSTWNYDYSSDNYDYSNGYSGYDYRSGSSYDYGTGDSHIIDYGTDTGFAHSFDLGYGAGYSDGYGIGLGESNFFH
jgi:hypothetical protein